MVSKRIKYARANLTGKRWLNFMAKPVLRRTHNAVDFNAVVSHAYTIAHKKSLTFLTKKKKKSSAHYNFQRGL